VTVLGRRAAQALGSARFAGGIVVHASAGWAALMLLWASQHLDNLWRLETRLAERAPTRAGSTSQGALQRLRLLLS